MFSFQTLLLFAINHKTCLSCLVKDVNIHIQCQIIHIQSFINSSFVFVISLWFIYVSSVLIVSFLKVAFHFVGFSFSRIPFFNSCNFHLEGENIFSHCPGLWILRITWIVLLQLACDSQIIPLFVKKCIC